METFGVVPVLGPSSGLASFALNSGETVIGRMSSNKSQGGKYIALNDVGAPKKLLKFVSKRHASFTVGVQGSISVTALASMQVSNSLVRVNDHALVQGVPTSVRVGDTVTLLSGATDSLDSETPSGDLDFRIVSPYPPPPESGVLSPLGGQDDTLELEPDVAVVEVGSKRETCAQGQVRKKARGGGAASDESPATSSGAAAVAAAGSAGVGGTAAAAAAASSSSSISTSSSSSSSSSAASPAEADKEEATEIIRCGLCLDIILEAWSTGCSTGHSYCKGCILPWFEKKRECPGCQQVVSGTGHANIVLDQMVALLCKIKTVDEEERVQYEERRRELTKQPHPASASSGTSSSSSAPQSSQIGGGGSGGGGGGGGSSSGGGGGGGGGGGRRGPGASDNVAFVIDSDDEEEESEEESEGVKVVDHLPSSPAAPAAATAAAAIAADAADEGDVIDLC